MTPSPLTELHAPLLPFLRAVLATAPIAREGVIVDLACGDLEKWDLYQEALGPAITMIGADWVLSEAASDRNVMVADAHALPLCAGSVDGVLCVAAFGAFAEPQRVLSEILQVLRPGAVAVVVTAEQRWAWVWHWPPALAARIADACERVLLPPAEVDLIGDLLDMVYLAGFVEANGVATLLDAPYARLPATLALLPWERLVLLLAPLLSTHDLQACQRAACELELRSICLAVWGSK